METVARLRQVLASDSEVRFALLFGSRARGDARPSSDWDVGVHLGDGLSADERFSFQRRVLAELAPEVPVDLVILDDAPPLLAHQALLDKQLFVRDRTAYVRFFVRTLALSGDEKWWRRLHARRRQERLQAGTFGRP